MVGRKSRITGPLRTGRLSVGKPIIKGRTAAGVDHPMQAMVGLKPTTANDPVGRIDQLIQLKMVEKTGGYTTYYQQIGNYHYLAVRFFIEVAVLSKLKIFTKDDSKFDKNNWPVSCYMAAALERVVNRGKDLISSHEFNEWTGKLLTQAKKYWNHKNVKLVSKHIKDYGQEHKNKPVQCPEKDQLDRMYAEFKQKMEEFISGEGAV